MESVGSSSQSQKGFLGSEIYRIHNNNFLLRGSLNSQTDR